MEDSESQEICRHPHSPILLNNAGLLAGRKGAPNWLKFGKNGRFRQGLALMPFNGLKRLV